MATGFPPCKNSGLSKSFLEADSKPGSMHESEATVADVLERADT